jgi:hypothetical protein
VKNTPQNPTPFSGGEGAIRNQRQRASFQEELNEEKQSLQATFPSVTLQILLHSYQCN